MPAALSSRSAALDAVRVVGILAVVTGHAVPDEGYRTALFLWHVPVFFVLSGYLTTPGRSVTAELLSRWRSLGRPYVLWLVLIGAAVVVTAGVGASDIDVPRSLLGALLGGSNAREPFTTIWFVSVLAATSVYVRLLLRASRWPLVAAAIVGLAAAALAGPLLAASPLGIGSAAVCIVFVVAGHLARPGVDRLAEWWSAAPVRRFGAGAAAVGVFALAEAMVLVGAVGTFDIKYGDYGTPVITIALGTVASLALVVIARVAFDGGSARVARVITALAVPGLLVVLAHPVLQWWLRGADEPVAVRLALMILVPWVLALAAGRTAASPWLTGAARSGGTRIPPT